MDEIAVFSFRYVLKLALHIFVVCFITKSFLTCSPTPASSTICKHLSSYMCSFIIEAAKVCSSYSHLRGPGISWFSDRSNCSHLSFKTTGLSVNSNIYPDQWKPIFICHSITLLVGMQLCSPRCWHLDSNLCRTRCGQSQLRFVLSPPLLYLTCLFRHFWQSIKNSTSSLIQRIQWLKPGFIIRIKHKSEH